MPTTVSKVELEQFRKLLNEHFERTGESVTALAERTGVRRERLSLLRSGSRDHSPRFDVISRIARAIGRRIEFPKDE